MRYHGNAMGCHGTAVTPHGTVTLSRHSHETDCLKAIWSNNYSTRMQGKCHKRWCGSSMNVYHGMSMTLPRSYMSGNCDGAMELL